MQFCENKNIKIWNIGGLRFISFITSIGVHLCTLPVISISNQWYIGKKLSAITMRNIFGSQITIIVIKGLPFHLKFVFNIEHG